MDLILPGMLIVGCVLALIALMPKWDGDWDG